MLYNAARPLTFDEMKGQELVVENIRNQSIRGEFFPVIILCGQYGSGKTTMARLIAMSANCRHKDAHGNPCGECESCMAVKNHTQDGIIEIDGASNNGVDAIRALIEQMNMLSVYKKKVIVIDEAHMLSKAAWNALLITLENPPEHCIVILCTTEKEALPATVVSRAPVYMFGKIPDKILKEQILTVAGKSQIQIEEDAAGVLARYADGAMRNALQLLEHLSIQHPGECITETDVVKTLGLSSMSQRSAFLRGCLEGNVEKIVKMLNTCFEQGINFRTFLQDSLKMNTDLLLTKSNVQVVGTEYYLQELQALRESCTEANIVTLNQILSKLCTIPGNQLSIERIVVDMVSVLYHDSSKNGSESISKARTEETPHAKLESNLEASEVAEPGQKEVKEEMSETQASESAKDDLQDAAMKRPKEPDTGSPFTGFGAIMGGMGFGGFGSFSSIPIMSETKPLQNEQVCAGSLSVGTKNENSTLLEQSAENLETLTDVEAISGFKKMEAQEMCPFEETCADTLPAEEAIVPDEWKESLKSDDEQADFSENKEEDSSSVVKDKQQAVYLEDSRPVEERSQISWDEMAALGITESRESLKLPEPPSHDEVVAEYKRQAEEREQAEEEEASAYRTRADLANARVELGKLLKNPGFEMLYKKARLEEVDYEIHLYFKNIVQLKAMQLLLINSKGIIAEMDK